MANSLPVYLVSFFSRHVLLTITLLLFLNAYLVGVLLEKHLLANNILYFFKFG